MRHLLVLLALLAVAASPRGGCGKTSPYEPCAGKPCGAGCTVCAPGDPDCVENLLVKACNASGACVPAGGFACPVPPPVPDPCEAKRCGDPCTIDPPCRSAVPPCLAPSLLGHCDGAGSCVVTEPVCPPPADPCAGKACGDTCNPCGDASPCPTFAATACDRWGACVTEAPWLCYDACAGKACGESCSICPPGVPGCYAPACVSACGPDGRCLCASPGLCP